LRTEIKEADFTEILNQDQVLILDTIGELLHIYAISDIVFVGKSLIKPGAGHNVLEPAAYSKPVIWGQYMSNFREIENLLLKNNAGLKVLDENQLQEQIEILLEDENLRKELGNKALDVLLSNRGSVEKTLNLIVEVLKNDHKS